MKQAPQASRPILWRIAQEHLDEAEFLFGQWENAQRSPAVTFDEARRGIELRLLAHIEALSVAAPPVAQHLLLPALEDAAGEWPRAAAAALALLHTEPVADRSREIFAALDKVGSEARRGIVRALQVADVGYVVEEAKGALSACAEPTRAALLEVLAEHRVDPGPVIGSALAEREPTLAISALQAAQAVPVPARRPLGSVIEQHLAAADTGVREAALETGLVWGLPAARDLCRALAAERDATALLYCALAGTSSDFALIDDAVADPKARAPALWALGFAGTTGAAEACLAYLDDEDPIVARVAGESFAAITGLPWQTDPAFAVNENAPAQEQGRADADEEEVVELFPAPEMSLPLLPATAVRRWWQQHSPAFERDERYLLGQRRDRGSVVAALGRVSMRRRRELLREEIFRSRGSLLVSLHSFSERQVRQLRALSRAGPG